MATAASNRNSLSLSVSIFVKAGIAAFASGPSFSRASSAARRCCASRSASTRPGMATADPGSIFPRAAVAVSRTHLSSSLSNFVRAGTAALASGPIFPRATTAAIRRCESPSNSVRTGTAAFALGPRFPSISGLPYQMGIRLSFSNPIKIGERRLDLGASRSDVVQRPRRCKPDGGVLIAEQFCERGNRCTAKFPQRPGRLSPQRRVPILRHRDPLAESLRLVALFRVLRVPEC